MKLRVTSLDPSPIHGTERAIDRVVALIEDLLTATVA
jgi:hypothetical protein